MQFRTPVLCNKEHEGRCDHKMGASEQIDALRHLGLAGWIHGGNPDHDDSDSDGPSPTRSPSHGLLHFDTVSFSSQRATPVLPI
jgi:hypothetical protein